MKRKIKIHVCISDIGEVMAYYYEGSDKKDQTDVGVMSDGMKGTNVLWGTVETEIDFDEAFKRVRFSGDFLPEKENSNVRTR